MNRARTENDFAAPDALPSLARAHPQRNRATPIELDAVHQGIADDFQIATAACRLEVRVISRDARVVAAIHRVGRNAGPLGRVVIRAPSVAEAQAPIA